MNGKSAPGGQPARSGATGAPRPTGPTPPAPLLPAVSLPTGGGAIRGIDEKFSTNPATGTGSLAVPLAVSKGRQGFDVSLELRYDSGTGNGPFGLGWQLSPPAITRKTDKGLPRYRDDGDEADVFALSGADDLVPAGNRPPQGDYDIRSYRPRSEGLFARIERWTHRTSGAAHWRTTTRNNFLNIFGLSADARIANPDDPSRIFSWLLEESRDGRGNVARYRYKPEDPARVDLASTNEAARATLRADGSRLFHATAQRYLKRVQYGNRLPVLGAAAAPVNDDDYLFEVVLDYGEHDAAAPAPRDDEAVGAAPWLVRADPFSTYRSGFEVRTYRLCRRALVFHRFAELGGRSYLVRSTDFTYEEQPALTYLRGITQVRYERDDAAGGYVRAAMPSLDVDYVRATLNQDVRTIDPGSLDGTTGVDGSDAQWVDLDGEGIPGVLIQTTGAWFYKRNLGGGRLAPAALVTPHVSPADLTEGVQQLVDLGGDGTLDLVRYAPPLAGYFERTAERSWAPFAPLEAVPNLDATAHSVRFADLDGDGLSDMLALTQDAVVWYRSRGEGGFEPAAFVRKPQDERDGPAVLFADGTETIQLADMSGDGLTDIVCVRNGEVAYWPNLGYGRFGRKVTLANSPTFDAPDQFDARRIRLADVDGSGTSDIVYAGRDGIRLFFNRAGNSLSDAERLNALPGVDSSMQFDVVDLLGLGTACLVWSSPLAAVRRRPLMFVDLMGGRKPHLLASIVNNMGAETRISYSPSTRFYLEDAAAGRPWLTRLAFPVHVIDRVERADHVGRSHVVTTYTYRHGYFDGGEREFRGFARVEQRDAETFSGDPGSRLFPPLPYDIDPNDDDLSLPPTRIVSWFHTGAWLERERLEQALAREYYQGDPLAPLLTDTVVPALPGSRAEREAARALRGQMLRQEVYTDDGGGRSAHPFTVSERSFEVQEVQPPSGTTPGIYFAHPRHSIELQYERDPDDPRARHELVLAVDAFGNVTESVTVAYPRRAPAEPEQARPWATLTERSFANRPAEADWYRVGVPIEMRTSELTGLPPPAGGFFEVEAMRQFVGTAAEIPFERDPDGTPQRRTVERERRLYYRDHPDVGAYRADPGGPLALGTIAPQALPHEVYRQVFTPLLLTDAYGLRVDDAMLRAAGYVQQDGLWWTPSGRGVFDPATFFLAVEALDAFGRWTATTYDAYALLPTSTKSPRLRIEAGSGQIDVVDPVRFGSVTLIQNDYRMLAPTRLTDPNGGRNRLEFNTLGLVARVWLEGRAGDGDGDPADRPGVEFRYDTNAWQQGRGPVYAHAAVRETHGAGGSPFGAGDTPVRQGFQHARVYSDGSGREVMKKAQAEAGPVPVLDANGRLERNPDGTPRTRNEPDRWVGTGRTVFDNKGNAVKQYEPFFSATIAYENERDLVEWGVTPVLRYDALGRMIRRDRPDGTHTRVVIEAWTQQSWDENDTIAGTPWLAAHQSGSASEQRAATLALQHAGTPIVEVLDPRGRVCVQIADNGAAGVRPTRLELDVEDNLRSVTDARGNMVLRQLFDMTGRPIRSVRADAGPSNGVGDRRAIGVAADPGGLRTLFDAANRVVHSWDERDVALRQEYDEMGRLLRRYVRPGANPERLVERVVYGEAHPQAAVRHLRTRPHLALDEAGALEHALVDFKGNPVEIRRRVTRAFRAATDWSPLDAALTLAQVTAAADPMLEAEAFVTTAQYDGMNRLASRTTPDASVTTLTYNEAGLIETVDVRVRGGATRRIVAGAGYNARGQREVIELGNGTTTTYGYDPFTFRLTSQRTTVTASGAVRQDLRYQHDPVGNIVAIDDAVSYGNAGVSASGAYEYDAVYQLVRAEGREHPGLQREADDSPLLRLDHPNDLQALRRYRQTYAYDRCGNIERVVHQPLSAGAVGWTRTYAYAVDRDRLLRSSMPGDAPGTLSAAYGYDLAGGISAMPHLPAVTWDEMGRLRHAARQNQIVPAETNDVYFAYDAAGKRVRKVYEHGAVLEERIYLGTYEVYRRRPVAAGAPVVERQTLHVEVERRVALLETKTIDALVPAFTAITRERFQLDNHLGSSVMELDGSGGVISYEEYYPFGSASMLAADSAVDVSARRYRYTGKELDDETGLMYFGARYYAPWLTRWANPDPAGLVDGTNRYAYARNNPVRLNDPTGEQAADTEAQSAAAEGQAHKQQSHVIILGENIPGRGNGSGSADKWLNKLLNTSTVERFSERVAPGDRILIALSPDVTQEERDAITKVVTTFQANRTTTELDLRADISVQTVAPKDLAKTVNALDNISTLIFMGHGSQVPMYGDWSSFPKPTSFDAAKFSSDATALWASCNLDSYAESFTKHTGVTSLGVEGTTWFGTETITAGKLNGGAAGTSKLWRFDMVKKGEGDKAKEELVKSGPFSINSWGIPILQPREGGNKRDPFEPSWPDIYIYAPKEPKKAAKKPRAAPARP